MLFQLIFPPAFGYLVDDVNSQGKVVYTRNDQSTWLSAAVGSVDYTVVSCQGGCDMSYRSWRGVDD
jgi:hypothetical protein